MISYVFGVKMEKFMESEHSGISRVEVVTTNVVPGSSETHLMHMKVKPSIFNILLTRATLKNYCTILIFRDHLIDTFYVYY